MLTGASSQLGVFLIPRLLEAGFRVVALSRQASVKPPDSAQNPLWLHPDAVLRPLAEKLPLVVTQADYLISCGPLDFAADILRRCAGLRRAVVFSTSSVFSKAGSPEREENEKITTILAGESDVKTLCEERALPLLVLRPTLIYGCGLDQNISRLAAWIKRYGWLPVAGPARGLRQPVHADDLAQVAVAALTREQPLVLDSVACGGSTISYRQMVELIFDSVDRPRRVIGLPAGLLAAVVRLLSKIPSFQGMNQQMVLRQNIDLVFDDTPLMQELNYNPRPFKPGKSDFEIPPSANRYQLPEC